MKGIWGRTDFVEAFVVCPVCGRVWFKRLYSTGAVRMFPADGADRVEHAACKELASKQAENLGNIFKGRGSYGTD